MTNFLRKGGPAGSRRRARPRLSRRVVLAALVALGLLINGVFLLLYRTAPRQMLTPSNINTGGLNMLVALDDNSVVAATTDDRLVLLENGRIVQERQLGFVIGALAVDPKQGIIYVGTADGKVMGLDLAFVPLSEVTVKGRVVGLSVAPSGALYVAHGVAVRTDQFYISCFPAPGQEPVFSAQAAFTVYGLAALGESTVYGTGNSRVVALEPDGATRWSTVISFPVIRLITIPELDQVMASDGRGGVTLLDSRGQILWEAQPTGFALRALGFDAATRTYLAGDENGNIAALDREGNLLGITATGKVPILAFLQVGSEVWNVVPREGNWQRMDLRALRYGSRANSLRNAWILADLLWLIILGAALLRTSERSWSATKVLGREMRRSYLLYLFIAPSLALILLFSYYPAIMALYTSLSNKSLRRATEFVGLANYVKILKNDVYFWVGFRNMLIMIGGSILKTFTVPLLIAELIFWLRSERLKYAFRTLFILPSVVPGLVTVMLWRMIYDPNIGLINEALQVIGLPQFQTAWLGNEQTALWAVIGAGFPYVAAFSLLIYLGGLSVISPELYDAAHIDGANWWSRFWRIDIPLLASQFRLLLFFALSGSIQDFASIWIFTRGGPGTATYTPALHMYRNLIDTEYGYGAAIGMLMFLMILVVTATLFGLGSRRKVAVDAME